MAVKSSIDMKSTQARVRHARLFELIRQQNLAESNAHAQRVSVQDGELAFAQVASASLEPDHTEISYPPSYSAWRAIQ